jgi:lipid A 3-O-deacylase
MKMGRNIVLILVMLSFTLFKAEAQRDTSAGATFLDLRYNNDTFTFTDIYYTHGFRLAYANPSFGKLFTRHLLLRMRSSSTNTYGLALVQDVFTPSSITRRSILYGDRPYAAYVYAGHFLISGNAAKKVRVSSELDAGILGPLAFGYEVQAGYHRLIHDKHPEGWNSQVKNDPVLNYTVSVDKGLLTAGKVSDLTVIGGINAGTLYDNASAGAMIRLGKLLPGFEDHSGARSAWQSYLFVRGEARVVGYNATLQGGVFDHSNVYTVPAKFIKRDVYSSSAGLLISWRNIELEHSYQYLSPELRTGMEHRWGMVRLKAGM